VHAVQTVERGAVDSRQALSQYTSNLNGDSQRIRQEAREHGGELVARSFDGRIDFVYAATEGELLSLLEAQGIAS
jgi:hypothetical protein